MNTAKLNEPETHEPETRGAYAPPQLGNAGLDTSEFAYRSVSKSAIASLTFAILGVLTAFLGHIFVLMPLLGLGFGLVALSSFRRFPEELTGKTVGKIGLILSLVILVTSVTYHSYIYATEVPPDHIRIAFSDLRPNPKTPNIPFSEKSMELDGKKVFLKGYVRPPGGKKRKLKEFILVGDFGDCCFGGNPKITDVVAISIVGDDTVDYGFALRRIAGTFHLNKQTKRTKEAEVPQVFYEIHTQEVR